MFYSFYFAWKQVFIAYYKFMTYLLFRVMKIAIGLISFYSIVVFEILMMYFLFAGMVYILIIIPEMARCGW